MNPFSEIMRNGAEIAAALIGAATIGLLVTNSQGTAQAATGVAQAFGGLLSIATFQNGFGLRSNVGNFAN